MPDYRYRGPRDRLHFPAWRKACWKGDPAGCCALCYGRLLVAGVRR